MILVHTTNAAEWAPHNGACMMDEDEAPRASYGENRFEVVIPDGLVTEKVDVSSEDIDANNWPGDRASQRAAYAASGIDIITYQDMDASGRAHQTWRLVSARAVAAVSVL
jgi:hypothetical protein